MAIGDVFKLTAVWQRTGQVSVAVNEFYCRQNSAIVQPSEAEDLVQAFRTQCENLYLALVTDFMSLMTYKVTPIPGDGAIYEESVATAGTRSGEPLPPITAVFVRTRTSHFSKTGRGGIYFPPALEGDSTNGKPSVAYKAAVTAFMEALRLDLNTVDLAHGAWQFGVYSKKDVVFRPMSNYSVRDAWSHQVDRRYIY